MVNISNNISILPIFYPTRIPRLIEVLTKGWKISSTNEQVRKAGSKYLQHKIATIMIIHKSFRIDNEILFYRIVTKILLNSNISFMNNFI